MVAPVIGPVYFSEQTGNRAFVSRELWKQAKPYNLPLPYETNKWIVTSTFNREGHYPDMSLGPNGPISSAALQKARERFVSKVRGSAAELAVSLAERQQALEMITARLLQMYQFTKALRQFRFGDAAVILGVSRVPKGLREKGKAFGNNYLEFHFGWSPLIGDIGNAIEVLQGGVPPVHVSAAAAETLDYDFLVSPGWRQFGKETVRAKVGATFVVSNPNLWLANQLGFVNPATVVWELVPFSFVLDWFVNVGDFLSSFSEFWGLAVNDAYYTISSKTPQGHEYHPPYEIPVGQADPSFWVRGIRVHCKRQTGLPSGPDLRIRDPWILSPRRGLAAVSLLLQQLVTDPVKRLRIRT